MNVTFTSVLLVVVLVATSMTSVEARKMARGLGRHSEEEANDDAYARERRLKGKSPKDNIFSKACKSAKAGYPTCAPSEKPSMAPSLSNAPSSEPSESPTDVPSFQPSPSPSDVPSFEPSQYPSGAPSVSNAPTKTGKSAKSTKSPKRARRLFAHGY